MICRYFLSLQTPAHLLALHVGSRVSVSVDAIMTSGTSSLTPPSPKKIDSSETLGWSFSVHIWNFSKILAKACWSWGTSSHRATKKNFWISP